jgi:hypothetical protein
MASIKILFALVLACSSALAVPGITVKHVDGTTTAYAEDELQLAIDNPLTACGDIIEIDPGASPHYIEPYYLRGPWLDPALGGPAVQPSHAKDCAASGKYITIRSSLAYQLTPGKRVGAEDTAYLAYVGHIAFGDGFGCTVFRTERAASFWRLQGLELSAPAVDCASGGAAIVMATYQEYNLDYALGRLDQFLNHITIDQCWIHGLDGHRLRDGILLDGNSMTVSNSTIENVHMGTDNTQESHAIIMENGRGPMFIFNNKLTAQTIPVASGGEITPTLRGVESLVFVNNWLYHPWKFLDWSGTTNPTPTSPCPVDSDAHGATYHNTAGATYWECQGAAPGTWTSISAGTYNALVAARIPGWQKNIIELKRISNLHGEGNLLDQSAQRSADNQVGTCFFVSLTDGPSGHTDNILWENNLCRKAGWGFGQSYDLVPRNPNGHTRYWTNGGRPMHNIVYRNNLHQSMAENIYTHPGFGDEYGVDAFSQSAGFARLANNISYAVTLDHNTFESRLTDRTDISNYARNTGFRMDAAYLRDGIEAVNQRMTNNVMTAGMRPISSGSGNNDVRAVSALWGPHAEIAANAFIDAQEIGVIPNSGINNIDSLIWHCIPGEVGCAYTTVYNSYPPNCLGNGGSSALSLAADGGACKYGIPGNFGFTSYPTDLTLQSGSPLKAAGLDGKDLGADLNTVGWATAGAEAGTMAPYLAMKIRLIRPASTSAFVRFSAIDTSSCTVAARVYGFPLSSPVATATVNTGDLDRTTTLTGLTAGTRYGLKVTCAGSYYREDEFRTP